MHAWEISLPWNLCISAISTSVILSGCVYLVAFALHRAHGPQGPLWYYLMMPYRHGTKKECLYIVMNGDWVYNVILCVLTACYCHETYHIFNAGSCSYIITQNYHINFIVIFQQVNMRTQILLQCMQCLDYALVENTFRILLQSGYSKWHHPGQGGSTRTRMGPKIR